MGLAEDIMLKEQELAELKKDALLPQPEPYTPRTLEELHMLLVRVTESSMWKHIKNPDYLEEIAEFAKEIKELAEEAEENCIRDFTVSATFTVGISVPIRAKSEQEAEDLFEREYRDGLQLESSNCLIHMDYDIMCEELDTKSIHVEER